MKLFAIIVSTLAIAPAVNAFGADLQVKDASTVKDSEFDSVVSRDAQIVKVAGALALPKE